MSNQDLMIDIFDFNFDGPDDADQWQSQYPPIQWNNKEKAWEFPLNHWAGTAIESGHEMVMVDHGENDEAGFLLPVINVSVIAHRSVWETQGPEGDMIYSQNPDFSAARWSKRYNFLVVCQEAGTMEPCIITVRGYTGEALFDAISQGRKRTVNMVKQLTGKALPGYLFWLTLSAGAKRMVGKEAKSAIYPPACLAHDISGLDKQGLIALLQALYVGDALRDMYTAGLYDQGQQWSTETPRVNALPAPAAVPQIEAGQRRMVEIDDAGTLIFDDLSASGKGAWIDCAMEIPDLFKDRGQAMGAFATAMRVKGLSGIPPSPEQWAAWREWLTGKWYEKMDELESVRREAELRGGSYGDDEPF